MALLGVQADEAMAIKLEPSGCNESNDQRPASAVQQAATQALVVPAACWTAAAQPKLAASYSTGAEACPAALSTEQLPLQDSIRTVPAAGQPHLLPISNMHANVLGAAASEPALQPDLPGSCLVQNLPEQALVSDIALHDPSRVHGWSPSEEPLLGPCALPAPHCSPPGPSFDMQQAASETKVATGQLMPGSGLPAQQTSCAGVHASEPMLGAGAAPDAGLTSSSDVLQKDQQSCKVSTSMPQSVDLQAGAQQLLEPIAPAANTVTVTVKAEPGSSAAEQAADIKAEPDTIMEETNNRSAADIFEQTVIDCKAILSEAGSVLLDEAAPGSSSGSGSTSRIAAAERATRWQNELQGLLTRCKIPQLYIGVLGDTGKSSMHTVKV